MLQNTRKNLHIISFIFKKFYKKKPKLYRNLIFFTFITGLSPLITKFISGKIIDIVISNINSNKNFYSFQILSFIFIAIFISLILRLFYNLETYFRQKQELFLQAIHDSILFEKYQSLDAQLFDDPNFVKIKNKIEWNLWQVSRSIFSFINIIIFILIGLINALILLDFNILVPILTIISSLPQLIITKKFGRRIWSMWDTNGEEKIKYNIYKRALYASSSEQFQELKLFNFTPFLLKKAIRFNDLFAKRILKIERKRLFISSLFSIFEYLIVFFVLLIIFNNLYIQNISIGKFYFFYSISFQLKNNIDYLIATIGKFSTNMNLFADFYKLMNYKTKIRSGNIKLKETPFEIEFKDVWFKYPNSENYIFKNLNFAIYKDEDVAIVGENGAGKTTLLKLLTRVYDPNRGDIFINSINLKDIDLDKYYKQIAFLSQKFLLPPIKVKENIFIGDTTKNFDIKNIETASKKAQAHKFILGYPYKYDTFLTNELKSGILPSGGQSQRIAIARSFFKDASLIILDEPTSAIDSIAEEKIFDNILSQANGKTIIIISHRFSTVKKAKRILVLDKGQIIEDGNHHSLIKSNGLYAKMYKLQMK